MSEEEGLEGEGEEEEGEECDGEAVVGRDEVLAVVPVALAAVRMISSSRPQGARMSRAPRAQASKRRRSGFQ